MAMTSYELDNLLNFYWEKMTQAMESDKNVGKPSRLMNGDTVVNFWNRKVKRVRALQRELQR